MTTEGAIGNEFLDPSERNYFTDISNSEDNYKTLET